MILYASARPADPAYYLRLLLIQLSNNGISKQQQARYPGRAHGPFGPMGAFGARGPSGPPGGAPSAPPWRGRLRRPWLERNKTRPRVGKPLDAGDHRKILCNPGSSHQETALQRQGGSEHTACPSTTKKPPDTTRYHIQPDTTRYHQISIWIQFHTSLTTFLQRPFGSNFTQVRLNTSWTISGHGLPAAVLAPLEVQLHTKTRQLHTKCISPAALCPKAEGPPLIWQVDLPTSPGMRSESGPGHVETHSCFDLSFD